MLTQTSPVKTRIIGFPPENFTLDLPANIEIRGVVDEFPLYHIQFAEAILTFRACCKCATIRFVADYYPGQSCCKKCHIAKVRHWQTTHHEKVKKCKRDRYQTRKTSTASK